MDFTIDWLTYLPLNAYVLGDIDDSGNLYGASTSNIESSITTPNTFQPTFMPGETNGYIFKLSPEGQLIWATYNGKTYSIAINYSRSRVTVSAIKQDVENTDYYSTPNAYQTTPSKQIISVFDSYTGDRIYSTYLGNDDLSIYSMGVDDESYYLFGSANGELTDDNLISPNAYQTNVQDNHNYYLGKFDIDMHPIWGTYIGGSEPEIPFFSRFTPIKFKDGHIYIAASTESDNFIDSPNMYQEHHNGGITDLIMMKFSQEGDLIWGSFFGGQKEELTGSIVPVSDEVFYLVGITASTDEIATPGAYQEYLNVHPATSPFFDYSNGFVAKFTPNNMGISSPETDQLVIFPNPTTDRVYITGNLKPYQQLTLFDFLGRPVLSKPVMAKQNTYLNLQGISQGIYFIRLEGSNSRKSVIRKLVVK